MNIVMRVLLLWIICFGFGFSEDCWKDSQCYDVKIERPTWTLYAIKVHYHLCHGGWEDGYSWGTYNVTEGSFVQVNSYTGWFWNTTLAAQFDGCTVKNAKNKIIKCWGTASYPYCTID